MDKTKVEFALRTLAEESSEAGQMEAFNKMSAYITMLRNQRKHLSSHDPERLLLKTIQQWILSESTKIL